jgi:hypothetical protein
MIEWMEGRKSGDPMGLLVKKKGSSSKGVE